MSAESGLSQSGYEGFSHGFSGFPSSIKINYHTKICVVKHIDHKPLAQDWVITPNTAMLNTYRTFALFFLFFLADLDFCIKWEH